MDTETTFFQDYDITVTNARFIVGGKTFAMRTITSVEAAQIPASYGGAVALILLGLSTALLGFPNSQIIIGVIGVCILALGIWDAVRQKPIFEVVLRTAGGDVTAYRSYDWDQISQIIEALNQSIISHG